MSLGILGTKEGMTQLFDPDTRKAVPVTVIHAEPNIVLKQHTQDSDGYSSVQVAYGDVKAANLNRPDMGQFNKAATDSGDAISPRRHLREFRLDEDPSDDLAVGAQVTVSLFEDVKFVDVAGTSKGKGTQGVMKLHNFRGFVRTHGTHEFFRHGGAIGTRLTPGHVLKGKKMPARMGNERVTVQNLRVHSIDTERNLLLVVGAIPGARGGLVEVRPATKK
ncbi:MAG: 50S ribosomal protein L3 [Deltaproteobacteria bacterium]|nr:50S ribosomal protein L3 [Deltaproteobacteria bacterium]